MKAKPKRKPLTERQRFEAWCAKNFYDTSWRRSTGYLHWETHHAWLGWQASARARRSTGYVRWETHHAWLGWQASARARR